MILYNKERLCEALLAGGWSPDRQVDVTGIDDACMSRGVPFHAAAQRGAKEFEGVSVKCREGEMTFSVLETLELFEETELDDIQSICDQILCPIAYRQMQLYLVGEDSSVVVLDSHWVCYERFNCILDATAVAANLCPRYEHDFVLIDR